MDHIVRLLKENKIEEAISLLNEKIEADPSLAENYYQLGNAYQKLGDFKNAINNYLKAIEIDPSGPAKEAYKMTNRILEFYNKDMFNH